MRLGRKRKEREVQYLGLESTEIFDSLGWEGRRDGYARYDTQIARLRS